MEKSRFTVALRLFLLLGLPILVLLGLFTFGVRLGVHNKDRILAFEQRVFGFEVARDDDGDGPKKPDAAPEDDGDGDDAKSDAAPEDDGDRGDRGVGEHDDEDDEGGAEPGDGGGSADGDAVAEPDPRPTPPRTASEDLPAIASRPTPPDDLVGALAGTRVVTVKVLVDSTTIDAHPAWVDYVQRLVSLASANYGSLFGIQFQLYGVMRWDVSPNPIHADDFLQLVKEQPRDGADLLIAITDREMVDEVGGSSEVWPDGTGKNGAYAVVYASPERDEPHLQGTMHELGHLMGAKDVTDPESSAFRGDNFMSYAAHQDHAAPTIDAENLRRVLSRKTLPFVSDTDRTSHERESR